MAMDHQAPMCLYFVSGTNYSGQTHTDPEGNHEGKYNLLMPQTWSTEKGLPRAVFPGVSKGGITISTFWDLPPLRLLVYISIVQSEQGENCHKVIH